MDQLTNVGNNDSKAKRNINNSSGGLSNYATRGGVFSIIGKNNTSQKENKNNGEGKVSSGKKLMQQLETQSILSSLNNSSNGGEVVELKREMTMLRKELKRVSEEMEEKNREVEKLKKENFNLINRCRNTLATKK